ncbi:YjgN family protein [Sphingomonas sp. CJ20]
MHDNTKDSSAFAFGGTWREFAPIAFTNLLLTIVTLGVYSFWARARERRYLWGRTRFIGDPLEWAGTGMELFIGYILAFFVFLLPLGLLQFAIQALILRGHEGAAGLLLLGLYLLLFYVIGLAVFRALRYRLSRTYWRGIRGGSDAQGFRYAWSSVWRTILGSLALGLMVPWAMVSLWNKRWNAMSFGPYAFESVADSSPLMKRYLLYYLLPIVLFIGAFVVMMAVGVDPETTPEDIQATVFVGIALFYLIFFVLFGLIALFFYAAYFREVVGNLSLGQLEFAFTARTVDWLKLVLGSFALVVCTLGIGAIFLGYRNWAFFVRHLEAYGEIDLGELTQSTTRKPGQGEGLLDAFDVGAF